jgi:1,2-phenylacetyl-CoA epoxidase PaaB subunit
MGARSLFMKRGSGSTPVVVVPSGARAGQSQSQSQSKSQAQQQQQQHYGTVAAAESEEELLMAEQSLALSQRRNPIAKAMGSSIGLLASVGLFIYGFGMVFGYREAILERWRMASSP